jgi:hypothetical protein
VHEAGEEFLARAGLAVDKNGGIGSGHLHGQAIEIAHGPRLDHEFAQTLLGPQLENLDFELPGSVRQFPAGRNPMLPQIFFRANTLISGHLHFH